MRIATCGRLPFAQCGYDLLISARSRNVLASSLASPWITATKFGCDINALFDNVRIL